MLGSSMLALTLVLPTAAPRFAPLVRAPEVNAAAVALERRRPAKALALARAALANGKLGDQGVAAASVIEGLALIRLGRRREALPIFAKLDRSGAPSGLASHLAYYHGKLLAETGQLTAAREPLSRVPLAGRFGFAARRLSMQALIASGDLDGACGLAATTARHLEGQAFEPDAWRLYAGCLERQADRLARHHDRRAARGQLRTAAGIYRTVAFLWPRRAAGRDARAALRRLSARHIRPAPPDTDALLARAHAMAGRLHPRRALWTLRRIRRILAGRAEAEAAAEVDLLSGEAAARIRWFRSARRWLRRVRDHAPTAELRARGALDLARLLSRWRTTAAIEAYLEVARRYPTTDVAAEALDAAAGLARKIDDVETAARLDHRCVESYPDAPAAAGCRWGLAWMAWRAGKPTEAQRWLAPILATPGVSVPAPAPAAPPPPPAPVVKLTLPDTSLDLLAIPTIGFLPAAPAPAASPAVAAAPAVVASPSPAASLSPAATAEAATEPETAGPSADAIDDATAATTGPDTSDDTETDTTTDTASTDDGADAPDAEADGDASDSETADVAAATDASGPDTADATDPAADDDAASPADLDARRFLERVRYWRARIREREGQLDAAQADYRQLVADHPYDYYALLAWARLLDLGAHPAALVPASDGKDAAPPQPGASVQPEVAAAATYLELGLPTEAKRTLRALRRERLSDPARRMASRLWLELGDVRRSHYMAPVPWEGGLTGFPSGTEKVDARLAYPRAFSDAVEGPARAPGVPVPLVYAIMRAESAFKPNARSPAGALGLTQVIRHTAYRVAHHIGIHRFRFWMLKRPRTSIQVGSAYLARLLRDFDGRVALAIAAYNAGEPAVRRWVARWGDLPLDAFLEEIPFPETKRYVRKVLSFYAIYRVLYEGDAGHPLGVDPAKAVWPTHDTRDAPTSDAHRAPAPAAPHKSVETGARTPAPASSPGVAAGGTPPA